MPLSLIIPKPHAAAASAPQFNRRIQVGTALVLMLSAMACEQTDAAGTLYWTFNNSLWRASTEGDCRQLIQYPTNGHVDVDPEMGKVYYLHYTVGSTIKRCDFDGANIEVVYSGMAAEFAIDRVNRKLYWSVTDDDHENQIMRSNLDGSSIELVISGLPTGSTGIAVDSLGGKVYWVQHVDGQPTSGGSIHRVNFDGTAHEQIAVAGQGPFGITVHHASGKVFWTDFGFGGRPGAVYRANLDFSNVEQIVTALQNLTGIAIDEAAGMLYFCRQLPDGVFRCDLNGGGLVTLGVGGAYDVACVPEEFGFVCFGDTNSDLHVNIDDILDVIGSWGPCRECPTDFNGDGTVNIADLLYVISHKTT